jgi:predicted RNA-binding protein YlqC (UPF0109 family)
MIKEFLEFVVKSLVDEPSEVEINEVAGDKVTLYELKVAKSDIGKIIGKKGKTAISIRTILNAVSVKHGKRAELEIIE